MTEQNDKRKFVLPPEYDETDSRWTLKYRKPAPGLVKLMEYSGVYVNAEKLDECKTLSNDCISLARRLLNEIFTASALSVCSVPGVKPSHLDNRNTDLRPQLDSRAMIILLKFVAECGLEKDWKVTDYAFIQNHIQRKLEVTRYVRFNCVEDESDTETVKRKRLDRKTLKHPFPSAELVELVKHSDVYVDADKLTEIKELSNDCVSLAQRLIREVFSNKALRECPWSRKTSNIFGELPKSPYYYVTTACLIETDELKAHAEIMLLHFVDEYGLKMGWPILDFQFIREILAYDIQKEAEQIYSEFLRNRRNSSEYDETDSRWTLKYREPAPGLVELMEHSDVYVNAEKLAECKTLSNDCVSLARRLLNEIFTASALSVCSVPGVKPSLINNCKTDLRHRLDSHAMIILLKFVTEYGQQKDWNVTDYAFIQNHIQQKLEVTRYVRINCVEDENDTKTVKRKRFNVYEPTLKHPFASAEHVELLEHSGVYVNADKLAEIKELSNDCVSLAQKLIREVFSKKALRECPWSRKTSNIFGELPKSPYYYVTTACLIETDEIKAHAEIMLLHFVDEYGLKMGWPILDFQFIREILAYEIQKEAEQIYSEFLRNRINSSEYDETDSRWTLKYREPAPGLVELMKHSDVYVNADKLAECKTLSNDCVSLARRLLNEIFTASALSVCSVPGVKPSLINNCNTDLRHQLDSHAMIILLKFVEEYGQQKDWKVTDYALPQNHIQRKLEVTRYVRFNCVEDENDTETVKKKRLDDYTETLKHPFPSAELVELIEHSDVYVDADKLAEIKELSNDCVSLAQRLLRAVFNEEALRECSLSRKTSLIFGNLPKSHRSLYRYSMTTCLRTDELEAHAEIILLHFVDEHGLKMGWPILDFQFIREILAHDIKKESEAMYIHFLSSRIKNNSKFKFVLPPEYDKTDSRWTLKYREPAPGLVELMEHSGVYVNAEKLAKYKTLSKHCVPLAQSLLNEIFTASALSVCSVPGAKPSHVDKDSTDRPQLDSHAMIILLKFVTEYGQQKFWKVTNYAFIQNYIQRKLEVARDTLHPIFN